MGFLLTVILCLALYYLYRLYREQQKTNARLDKVLSRQNRLYELLKPSSTTSITSSQPNTPSTSSFPRHTSAYSGRASSNVGIAGAYTPKYHDPVDPQDFVARGQVMAEKEACINAVKGVQEDMKALDEKHKRQREKLELRKKALEEDLPPDWTGASQTNVMTSPSMSRISIATMEARLPTRSARCCRENKAIED